ncbi:hypothetical protein D3C80_2143920 [compost metagenome]
MDNFFLYISEREFSEKGGPEHAGHGHCLDGGECWIPRYAVLYPHQVCTGNRR